MAQRVRNLDLMRDLSFDGLSLAFLKNLQVSLRISMHLHAGVFCVTCWGLVALHVGVLLRYMLGSCWVFSEDLLRLIDLVVVAWCC